MALRQAHGRPRAGFSLVEMLLAIFILGIGVISIAALFPAGIALQRQATDDTIGPIVAKNAFATIRSKLGQDDFGSFDDFGFSPFYIPAQVAGTIQPVGGTPVPQVPGDWGWMRPSMYANPAAVPNAADAGTIDVFSARLTSERMGFATPTGFPPTSELVAPLTTPNGTQLWGIPYNVRKYPLFPGFPGTLGLDPVSRAVQAPNVTFTKGERSFPQGAANYGTTSNPAVPQYHWECMFRRNGGKVQVAVFVYRVNAPGGDTRPYVPNTLDNSLTLGAPAGAFVTSPVTPPLPCLYLAPNFGTANSWPNRNSPLVPDIIPGTNTAATFSATAIWDDWQAPGQWLVDNHATVHRVLNGRTNVSQGPVKFQRPIPVLPASPVNGVVPTGGPAANAFIGGVWFIPTRDAKGNILTPVYAAVEDL
jgi:prepilin-type N-terminal cleavage/methylation domain-containing protein